MYNGYSAAYRTAVMSNVQKRAISITLDGVALTDDDFIDGAPKIKMSCLPNTEFEFGGTVSKQFTCNLQNRNQRWNGTRFNNKVVTVSVGLEIAGGTVEYIPCGSFYINYSGKPYSSIKIEAADKMLAAEKSYSDTTLTYPATLLQIAQNVASKMGISLAGSFRNSSYTVATAPNKDEFTYRDIIGFVAACAGGFAHINRSNQLEIVTIIDNQSNAYPIEPNKTRISVATDDIVSISGLAYYGRKEHVLLGTDTYPIVMKNNPLMDNMSDADRTALLNGLYSLYDGFTYYPMDLEFVGDPCLDEGDFVYLPSTIDGNVTTFIGNYVLGLTGTERIKTPSCSELDKNFLDFKEYKDTYYGGGGSGGGALGTFTHADWPEFSKAVIAYDTKNDPTDTLGRWSMALTFEDENGDPLPDSSYVLVVDQINDGYHTIVEGSQSGSSFVRYQGRKYDITNSAVTTSKGSTRIDTPPIADLKVYTTEEYTMLTTMFEVYGSAGQVYTPQVWPVFHPLSINRLYSSGDKMGSPTLTIAVNLADINFADAYYNVRENQLAHLLWYMCRYCLGSSIATGFNSHFPSLEAMEHFVRAFRTNIDSENWSGSGWVTDEEGTTPDDSGSGGDDSGGGGDDSGGGGDNSGGGDDSGGGDTTVSFTNPLPSITQAQFQQLTEDYNFELQYGYASGDNSVTLNYSYMEYSTWQSWTGYFIIDLSDVDSASATSFTKTIAGTNDMNISSVTLTYDTTNNLISVSQVSSGTTENILNTILGSSHTLTNS